MATTLALNSLYLHDRLTDFKCFPSIYYFERTTGNFKVRSSSKLIHIFVLHMLAIHSGLKSPKGGQPVVFL